MAEPTNNYQGQRANKDVVDKLNQTYNHKERSRGTNHHRSKSLKQRNIITQYSKDHVENEIFIDEDGEILSDLSKIKISPINKNSKPIIYRNMGPQIYNTPRLSYKDPSMPKYQKSLMKTAQVNGIGPEFDNNSLSTIVLDPNFDQQTMFDIKLPTSKRKLDPVVTPPNYLNLPYTTISLDQGGQEGEFQVNAVDLVNDQQQQMLGDLQQNDADELTGHT